ncbi:inactive phospholipase C-like protein 2 isoform X2 [Xenia sp. Carnegie-2017]|uniref:inactive phospholipase C-like protein 2 isoform X2 n=1 Tax=Xenia sp. Carnegie-2017 TaxID=2897299 RepID=UPI001F03851A|nr:inactive phospholipase C-like protein 2 isoform X2 [Xenia sp. Carnegie-2017]
MEEQERREESAENNSPNNALEDCEDVFGENSAGKLVQQRRSSIMKRKSVRTVSKSVSFSSIPSEKKVANASDCLLCMQSGTELHKVRSTSRQYLRFFYLEHDFSCLRWSPSTKKPEKAKIPLSMIKEVRSGKNTVVFRAIERDDISEDCAFTIIYGDDFVELDLIASNPDDANIWITGLRCLLESDLKSKNSFNSGQHMRDRWLKEIFILADTKNKGFLNENEVLSLLQQVNVTAPARVVKQKFKEVVADNSRSMKNSLNKEEFLQLYKDLTTRPEVYFLMARYASNKDYLTPADLLIFLESEQGLSRVGKDHCIEIINHCEPTVEGRKKKYMGIDGFTKYLLKSTNELFDSDCANVTQDMNQPLSHYFIASSHNTYLLEDQLAGRSSVTGYTKALCELCCRCIELDCWDGPDDEPVISHGKTLTSRIYFKDVVQAINDCAFKASEYPLIMSLKNHCCIKQQSKMADYLKGILKGKLHVLPPEKNKRLLPSPEELKGKILIKSKKLSDGTEEGDVTADEEEEDFESGSTTVNCNQNMKNFAKKKSLKSLLVKEGPKKTIKLARQLSDLVSFSKSFTFESFENSAENQRYWEVSSVNEITARKLITSFPEDFVKHNKMFVSRVHPSGDRFDSSNYNPVEMWSYGCQMVALNYQTGGSAMDLNTAMFNNNGRCGYILKPSVMREKIAYFNPTSQDAIAGITPQILRIKVISGQQFPKPKMSGTKAEVVDPFVSVSVYGIPGDTAHERTKTIPSNGFNPVFDESFEFHINIPELALVRFVVLDDDFIGDAFIGQYSIPVVCMRQGYRHIRLLNGLGEPMHCVTLFIHVTITGKDETGKIKRSSLKRSKKGREYARLRTVGVAGVDETFKTAIQPILDATDLRENVQNALGRLKETCGVPARSNIKQCLRQLASRMEASSQTFNLSLSMDEKYPYFECNGEMPEILKKAISALKRVTQESRNLVEKSDSVYEKIAHCERAGMEWHEEFQNFCLKEGVKEKRLAKISEAAISSGLVVWNLSENSTDAQTIKTTT